MRLLLVGLLIVAVVVASVVLASRRGIPVQTTAIHRGPIQEFVDEQAKTQLPRTYEITMPFAARVEAVSLREGDRIKKGQMVARIVQQDLEDEVAEAQAAVEKLTARLAENDDVSVENTLKDQAALFVDSMRSTVNAAESQKTASKSRMDFSETSLGRYRALLRSGGSTPEQVDQAELSFVESQVGYRQDVLNWEALKSLQSATDLMPRMILEYISRKSLTHNVLVQEKAEAEARLRRARQRQERGAMESPIDGIVLSRTVINEQFQSAGAVILRLGQIEQLEVAADLLSEDVGRIREGDPVVIYGSAINATVEQGVAGSVQRIYPAGFTKMSSLGVEQQRVTVIVSFADGVLQQLLDKQMLGVDFRVRVRIITEAKSDSLLAPRSALFRGTSGDWQVFAVKDGRARIQPIKAGLMNDSLVEVTEGLAETDQVIIAPDSAIRDGVRVAPE